MLKLMDLLIEGVQDKGIFKAVFMAGGPGSGKSFIKEKLFGIPDDVNISVGGLKSVNSDKEFMMLLNKYGFDPTMLATYERTDKDLFHHLSAPTKKGGSGLRDFAQELSKQRMKGYMVGKKGMVIDSTGSNFKKVQGQKEMLEKQGYDCYMVFVMTSLETAQKRNKLRAEKGERELPAHIVKKSWKEARNNLGGDGATNTAALALSDEEARHKFSSLVKGYANKWAGGPIQNPIGKQWVKDQLKLKKAGVK